MKFNITTILAIWGAVLSTVTVIWNLLRDRRDRPKLKLAALLEQIVQDSYGQPRPLKNGTGDSPANVYCVLVLTVTNVGRRPILITGWGTITNNSTFTLIPAIGAPVMLGEGEFHKLREGDPLRSALTDSVSTVFVRDSTGKDWNLPRKRLKLLRKEAKRLAGPKAA